MSSNKDERQGNGSVSLFKKYFKYFSVMFLVCLTFLSASLMFFVADYWEDQKKLELYNSACNIASFCENSTDGSDSIVLSSAIKGMNDIYSADIFIVSADPENAVVINCGEASSGAVCEKHSGIKIPGEIIISVLVEDQFIDVGNLADTYKGNHFIAAEKIHGSDGEVSAIVFATQEVNVGLKPYLTSFLKMYLLVIMAALLLVFLCVYFFSYKHLVKPIKTVAEATKHFSDGDFSYRIQIDQGKQTVAEINELQYAFNSMADALEDLEKSRSSFIANVSHELKTPMTTIGGFIDGIIDGTIDDEHRDHYLRIVSDEVKRLSRLVFSMLNMSKIESGQLRMNLTRVNITELICRVFIGFEQQIEAKKIRISGLDALYSVNIEADADMINQVFYNLIDNAVKFTDYGGEISVRANTDDEFYTVHIRNTGKGIGPDDIGLIFERFYKADKSRSLDAKSAGLGLFIVKSIIELHDGTITVDSVPEEFTEFTVKLKVKLIK